MSQLALLVDDVVTQLFPLNQPTLTIGRAAECDIRIDDVSVSTEHAIVRVSPSKYLDGHEEIIIEDLQSKNGTLVNEKPVHRCQLQPNDVVTIGWNKFKLLDDRAAGRETTVLMMLD